MKDPSTQPEIREFDTGDCLPPDDNRPAERPGIDQLVSSVGADTQLVAGLLCPHPDLPSKFLILDGVGRWYACGRLGIRFKALLLPGIVPEAERLKLRLAHNVIRRNMSAQEIADDAQRFMSLTGCTQEHAAKELNLSAASLSRALSVSRRIPESLRAKAGLVRPSIVAMIAMLDSAEAIEQALDFASTPDAHGKLPSREAVASLLTRYRERKSRGPKPKVLKGELDGRRVEIVLKAEETTASLVSFLKTLAGRFGEYPKAPPETLGFVFNG